MRLFLTTIYIFTFLINTSFCEALKSNNIVSKDLELSTYKPMIDRLEWMKHNCYRDLNEVFLKSNNLKFNHSNNSIELTGMASIEEDKLLLTGEKITIFFDENLKLFCEPNVLLEIKSIFDSTNKTDIRASKIILDNEKNIVDCMGPVYIRDKYGSFNADNLYLAFSKSNQLKSIHANLNVLMKINDYLISSENMFYNLNERKISMTGKSMLIQSNNMLSSNLIEYWLDSEKISFKKNVEMIFCKTKKKKLIQNELIK